MKSADEKVKYGHNPEYFWYRRGQEGAAYFIHQDGGLIRSDEMMGLIWRAADNRDFNQIYRRVNQEKLAAKEFVRTALAVMTAADILRSETDFVPAPRPAVEAETSGPLVSIIIINYNGRRHLRDLFSSIAAQNYRNFEVIMVDNASRDGSAAFVEKNWPWVKVIRERRNLGFAGGNNRGILAAAGDYVFLVNNDTKLEVGCLATLVNAAREHPRAAAVVPMLRFFSLPRFINAVGNSIGLVGWGTDNYVGYLDIGQFSRGGEVFSACFGATLISRRALDEVGLLDEKYRFYYEDSDWSYRARLRGFKIYLAPTAVVYHKFNATMNTLSFNFKLYLLVGNRIRFALKNLQLRAALAFTRRYLKDDLRHFLGALRRLNGRRALTYLRAWARLLYLMLDIPLQRQRSQRRRRPELNDQELFKLLRAAVLLDEDGCPQLNTRAVRSVYMHLLAEVEEQQSGKQAEVGL